MKVSQNSWKSSFSRFASSNLCSYRPMLGTLAKSRRGVQSTLIIQFVDQLPPSHGEKLLPYNIRVNTESTGFILLKTYIWD